MAVKRQMNWLGQMRVDSPHLRLVESAVAADFQALAGTILTADRPYVVSGLTLRMGDTIGSAATSITLSVAGAAILHATASEPGTVFTVAADAQPERLHPSNQNVRGSFTPDRVNYIGIDLVREADASTEDVVAFRSTGTKAAFTQVVPLGRTLRARIVISALDFEQRPNILPVAKVALDASGYVTGVTDCRPLLFRLAKGGTTPDSHYKYSFPTRTDPANTSTSNSTDPFNGGDKGIGSLREFIEAVQTRLWELGGGETWYSPPAAVLDATALLPNVPAQDAGKVSDVTCSVSTTTPVTFQNMTSPKVGQRVTFSVRATVEGTSVIFGSAYRMAAWGAQAQDTVRSITFRYDGDKWTEVSRSADITL